MSELSPQNEPVVESNEAENHDADLKKSRFSWSAKIAIVIIFIVIIGIGFVCFQLWSIHRAVNVSLKQLETTMQSQQTLTGENQLAIAQMKAFMQGSHDPLAEQEARYFIHMANFNLLFSENIPAAIALLQIADKYLSTVQNSRWLSVRKLIAQTILALKSVPKVDSYHIYMRIEALQNRIINLPLVPSRLTVNEKPSSSQKLNKSFWRRGLQTSWQAIKSVIVVKRHDHLFEPLLDQKQHQYLLLNLQMLLSQAQLALLQRHDDIYKASLQEVSVWIKQYFVGTNSATKEILNALDNLRKVNIAPALPSMNALMKAVATSLSPKTQTIHKNREKK